MKTIDERITEIERRLGYRRDDIAAKERSIRELQGELDLLRGRAIELENLLDELRSEKEREPKPAKTKTSLPSR